MSERIAYFDILRGLAVFGVVAIHSSGSGLQFRDNGLNFHFTILWRQLFNFSVPMFLTISGYFLAKKSIAYPDSYLDFLKKQIPRVYIPMFFWSVAWLVLEILQQNQSLLHEVYELLSFQSSAPYYFIALIIQYYILLPILRGFAGVAGLAISIAISIAMTVIIFCVRYYSNVSLPLIVYAGNSATWMMFFVLGLYLGTSASLNVSNRSLIIAVLTFYAMSCGESYALYAMFHQPEHAVTAVKASSFLYSFALIVFLFKNIDVIKSTVLRSVGEKSFGIYLIHMFVLMVASRILLRLYPPFQGNQPVYQLTLIGIVVLSCFLGISMCNRLLSSKLSQLIGFR